MQYIFEEAFNLRGTNGNHYYLSGLI